MPLELPLVFSIVAAVFKERANLVAENIALRHQLSCSRRRMPRSTLRTILHGCGGCPSCSDLGAADSDLRARRALTSERRFGSRIWCRGGAVCRRQFRLFPLVAARFRCESRNSLIFLGFGFFFEPEGRGFESLPACH